jgi:glycosyltransferase involved in cell wall biosynthesis
MRIAINCKKISGPYGGGNLFAINLDAYLRSRGHEVFRNLVPRLDLILIVSSKPNIQTTSFPPSEAADYLALHPNTVVVHRINTCDEQRAVDNGINRTVLEANSFASYTVFVSAFLRDLYLGLGFDQSRPYGVILTGADSEVFNPDGRAEPVAGEKFRLATHHWSKNYLKGFDIYERLDYLLDREPYRSQFEFTCIGSLPLGLTFHNTCHISPIDGREVASLLKRQHFYLTGARYEPGGNHYIEAMRCGLPVLYLESGSSAEYCAPYGGIGFNPGNFEEKLLEMCDRLIEQRTKVLDCPFTAEWMAEQYLYLFRRLVAERRENPRPMPTIGMRNRYIAKHFRRNMGRIKKRISDILHLRFK